MLIAVPIFVAAPDDVPGAVERGREAVDRGARLIEWRVDGLAGAAGAEEAVVALVRASPAPCIVTCRHEREGGGFAGPEAERLALARALRDAGEAPRYLDVERAALEEPGGGAWRGVRPEGSGFIESVHDLEGRPPDLLRVVEAMTTDPDCAVVKIAWRARSLRDNLEAFDLLAERRKPTIALCMGEFGLMSRVLAPKFGALLTFAAADRGLESAPGQPTIDDLRALYRFDAIGSATRVYGVVGWPVAHSRSPQVHNAAFASAGADAVYLPMPVPPEYEHFKATIGSFVDHPRLDLGGLSVTIPHKEHLVRFVRERGGEIEPAARAAGAGNTLMVRDGRLACASTDGAAALGALAEAWGPGDATGRRVVLLGAGGVARAIAATLARAGADVAVVARRPGRAAALADEVGARVGPGRITALDALGGAAWDALVNCTPVGMAGGPDPEGSPLPPDVAIEERSIVFDTVYAPARTPLIRDAEARGAKTVTGVEMFLRQAALQHEAWTGRPAPLTVMRDALRDR